MRAFDGIRVLELGRVSLGPRQITQFEGCRLIRSVRRLCAAPADEGSVMSHDTPLHLSPGPRRRGRGARRGSPPHRRPIDGRRP
jgi:hypothetical protein